MAYDVATLQEIGIVLSIVLIGVKFVAGFLFFRAYRQNTMNKLALGAGIYIVCMGLDRIVALYLNIITNFDLTQFQEILLFWKATNVFEYVGWFSLILITEREIYQKKTKNVFSILYVVLIVVMLALPDFSDAELVHGIANGLAGLLVPVSYVYLATKTEGRVRTKALVTFLAILLYVVGMLFSGATFVSLFLGVISDDPQIVRLYLFIIACVVKYVGITLMVLGMAYPGYAA